jgi:crossover junction endodeoxyribonuclease RuvC
MYSIIQAVSKAIQPDDIICIEGFGFASQSGFLLGGIGWGIRMELYRRGIPYQEVSPNGLKKFTGAGGTASKAEVAVETFKRWGFQCKSDNVTDAYVLAQIARAMHKDIKITKFQQEVINTIRNPQTKSKKKKENKTR